MGAASTKGASFARALVGHEIMRVASEDAHAASYGHISFRSATDQREKELASILACLQSWAHANGVDFNKAFDRANNEVDL